MTIASQLRHEVQLRDEVRVVPHDVDQAVLPAAGDIKVIEGPAGDVLHDLAVRLDLISDGQHENAPSHRSLAILP